MIGKENNDVYEFGPFRLEVAERRLLREGSIVALTTKVFDLLLALVRSAGRLQTREELIGTLWPDTIVEEHGLTSRISALRKALGDEGEVPCYIETVRGHGYRFVAPLGAEASQASAEPARVFAASPRSRRWRPHLLAASGAAALAVAAWVFLGADSRSAPPDVPPRSVVVLPFVNLSADQDNAYFASGIQDMILTKLAGIGDLRVISRTSTLDYASHPPDIRKVGALFGVATVLEGSVQKIGDRALINVQLIDARTDQHLWAQAYTRSLDDVFRVESDVAEQVAAALQAHLLPKEAERLATPPTRNSRAYDLFLQAEYPAIQVERGGAHASAESLERAVDLYRQALALDPDFALAEARLSFLHSYANWFGIDHSDERLAQAQRTAESALKSNLPQAHLAMGYVYYWGHRDYANALEQFALARQGLPNDAAVIGAIAFIERRQGKWADTLGNLEQAEILDPRNSLWFAERANTLVQLRRYAQAEEEYDRASAVDPQGYRLIASKALAQLIAGEPHAARATMAALPANADAAGVAPAVRFRMAWLDRQPDAALAAIAGSGDAWIEDPFMINLPSGVLRAQALHLKGDEAQAHREYEKTRKTLSDQLDGDPDNFNLLAALSVTDAGLGRKDAAIGGARRAADLMPVARDAIRGPSHLAILAETYALLGQARPAVGLLRQLLAMPAGMFVSLPLLRTDPRWDPIRSDPDFQALLSERASAATLAARTELH